MRLYAPEKPSRRALSCAGAVVSMLLLCGSGCRTSRANLDSGSATEATVAMGSFESRMLLTGELQAVKSDPVYVPRTPTWQMPIRWIAEDGAQVRAGQKVVELDNSSFAESLEQNRLTRSNALNELMRKEADVTVELTDKRLAVERSRIELGKARIEADVPPELVESREYQDRQLRLARAEVSMEKARQELQSSTSAAEAAIDELRIKLDRAEEKVRVAEAAIDALTLYAPSDGMLVVAELRREGRKFQVGDTVWVGLPVVSIPHLEEMQVLTTLSDVDDGKIAPGMPVTCTLDAFPERSFAGEVSRITPVAKEEPGESRRRAFRVLVRLFETDAERMRPGMSVRVEVQRELRERVLLVPRAGVDLAGPQPVARLIDGSEVALRLGACSAEDCIVEQGLAAGERVRSVR